MAKSILLFEDKLGISAGYEGIWQSLILSSGLQSYEIHRRNSFRSLGQRIRLLVKKGNRKSLGFNPDPAAQVVVKQWVVGQIQTVRPTAIICMDPVMLFLLNPDWDQATLDNLRGGTYRILGIPIVVSLPISAWHNVKKEKDIARMNEGFTDEEEFNEEVDEGDSTDHELNQIWMEPVTVPYGRFVLKSDLTKLSRIINDREETNQ